MSLRDSGEHWRALAKEVLTIADKIGDPENKRELIAIAEKYELLADRADVRAAIRPLSRGA
jgi:hypothetical protein